MSTKTKRRPALSPAGLNTLRRIAIWQRDAGYRATADDIVAADGAAGWNTLQSLLRRRLIDVDASGALSITGEGWRHLRTSRA